MARGINKVIIVGNLGNDPECRTFPDGGSITNVSVATSESWKDKQTGQKQERTEWHKVVFRNRLAEIAAQFLTKGSKVFIEGKLQTRKWQNQQGVDQYTTEIHAREMQILDSRQDSNGHAPAPAKNQQNQPPHSGGYQPNQNQGYQQPQAQPSPNANVPNSNSYQPHQAPDGFNDFDDDIPFSNYQLKVIV